MATDFKNIYFQIKRRPSPQCVLIALPMSMYRVETNEFEHGLNFFQKAVLKFKAKPGITDQTIAEYTGLDTKLIGLVSGELHSKGLINDHGSLSPSGKEKLTEIDGLVVNSGKKKIGYAFQFLNRDKTYPFYIQKESLVPADTVLEEASPYPQIITGTKGDEERTERPHFLKNIYDDRVSLNRPSERDIYELIQNSNKKIDQIEDDEIKIDRIANQLGIRFLNDQPEIVWLCTYIYLHESEKDTYDPDWRVLDPFGFGDSTGLRFYLNTPSNKNLLDHIQKRFSNVNTSGGAIFSEFQHHINNRVDEVLSSDFPVDLFTLDRNLRLYIDAIVRNKIILENTGYQDLDASVAFSLNIQNSLENILKQDSTNRKGIYQLVFNELDENRSKKEETLKQIFRLRLFSSDIGIPHPLDKICQSKLSRGTSLLSHLVALMLTYTYDNKSPLFEVLKGRIEKIIAVSRLRNEKGHGQTTTEKTLRSLTKDEVEKYYSFIRDFVNDYISFN
jgi:hypothetical protein